MRAHEWPSILIATTNPGKIREIRAAVAGLPVRWLTLADVPAVTEPQESGETFAENAWIKAQAYASATGLPTVAEDSGLAIDALGGRPGVESARYPGATYAQKFENLYRELAGAARPWSARFVSSVALAAPGGLGEPLFACEGIAEGSIAPAPRGSRGFGYDPIFIYAPSDLTGGELSETEKLAVSHRGKAFGVFREWLGEA